MADNAANRLVIAITGDTSQIEQQLRGLESRAAKIMRGADAGANKSSVLAAEQRRMAAEASANAKIETAAAKEREAAIQLEIAQLRAKRQELQGISGMRGVGAGLDPQVAAGLAGVSTRLANIRRESKAVGMEMYRNIGNPFLVVSSLSQRITGFYGMQRDAERLGGRMERVNDLMRRAAAQGRSMTVAALLKEFTRLEGQLDRVNKKMKGPGMMARGIADFGLNQFMTAGLFGIFQLNTLALQAIATPLLEMGTKIFRELFDRANLAKERMLALATAVEKAGSAAAFASQIGAAPGGEAERIAGQSQLLQRQAEYAKGLQDFGAAFMSRNDQQAATMKTFMEALAPVVGEKNFFGDLLRQTLAVRLPFGPQIMGAVSGQETAAATGTVRQFFAAIGPDAASQFERLYQAAGGSSINMEKLREVVAQVVSGMFELTDAQDKQRSDIQRAISAFQAQQQLDQLERERWSLTGSMQGIDRKSGADKWFMASINAAKQQERWQKAAAAYSQQLTRRQQRQTLGQAAADVTRAGIGRPGQTGFELAAAVLEARARAQETRQQIDIQRKQEAIQRKIEYWGSVQANADRQQRILANAVAIGMQQAQMVLTVDPKSGQLLARFVASDVWKMISGAIANNTPAPAPTSTGGGRGTGRIPTP